MTVLHGGPGTGKSRTVAAVVELARRRGKQIALAAPTGRAAKRLEELTGEPASTLHRLLGAQGRTGEFMRGETWPLDADVVVVDEASMLDVELAAALLDACADGDAPAARRRPGAAAVDRRRAGCSATSWTPGRAGDRADHLHRQAEGGAIARLASAVREGDAAAGRRPDPRGRRRTGRAAAATRRGGSCSWSPTRSPARWGSRPADVQVVTPVHRGAAGTIALNVALKAQLNPGTGTVGAFDVGDRVVRDREPSRRRLRQRRGRRGHRRRRRRAADRLRRGAGHRWRPKLLGDLVHGWALTVHRAQGSEWPAIVVALPPEAGGMLSRPLVYTALTRAQRHLSIVHAAGGALARGVREVGARPAAYPARRPAARRECLNQPRSDARRVTVVADGRVRIPADGPAAVTSRATLPGGC